MLGDGEIPQKVDLGKGVSEELKLAREEGRRESRRSQSGMGIGSDPLEREITNGNLKIWMKPKSSDAQLCKSTRIKY
jgi:hypothetical protein